METADAQVNDPGTQYEGTLNAALQNYQGVATKEAVAARHRAQLAMAEKVLADTQSGLPSPG